MEVVTALQGEVDLECDVRIVREAVKHGRAAAAAAATMEAASIAAEWRETAQGGNGGARIRCGPTCAGCFQTLQRPRLLKCLHIFCLTCLEGMVEATGPHSLMVRCAACEMETAVGHKGEHNSLENMNSDEGVLKIMSLLSDPAASSNGGTQTVATRVSTCDNCLQSNAALWCQACDAALCTQCSAHIHGFRSITATRQHNPIKLQPGERAPPRLPTCLVHPGEKLLFLSISKQQLICRECVLVGGHDKDRYVPVEDAGRQTRVDLADMIQQVQQVESQVDRALQEAAMRTPTVMDTYRARTLRLSSRADELKATMLERTTAALGEVAEERDRKAQRLLMQGVGIGRVAVALEHGALLGQLLMAHGNDLEVLRGSQSVERLLRAASAIAVDGSPVEGPALFSGDVTEASYDLGQGAGDVGRMPSRGGGSSQRESDRALAHRIPQSQVLATAHHASQIQTPHVPAPSTQSVGGWSSSGADTARANGSSANGSSANRINGSSKRQTLLSLPEPCHTPTHHTPTHSMPSSPTDSAGFVGLSMWGARKDSSNGTVQQQVGVGGVLGLVNNKVGWGVSNAGQSVYAIGGFDGAANLDSMEFFDSCSGVLCGVSYR